MPQRMNEYILVHRWPVCRRSPSKVIGLDLIRGPDVNIASCPRLGVRIPQGTRRHTHNDLVFNFTHCRSPGVACLSRLRVRILLGRADHSCRGVLPTVVPQRVNEIMATGQFRDSRHVHVLRLTNLRTGRLYTLEILICVRS
jgi:hypothetical protein